ncbi:MAG: hypothetical protein OEU26_31970 [Candidatus Tectomicrobia bacterium]|nr:hypothetical protein [Candidatus Tectomicrobia bacterium]
MTTREIVLKHLAEVVTEYASFQFPDDVTDATKLGDFWLDSIVYTAFISRLEEEVGYIPSAILEGAFFPETIGDLVSMYEGSAQGRA